MNVLNSIIQFMFLREELILKLISLTVSHLFGLKYNVNFDFTENNRICIIGENGSGKSSIMDSIRLALFGEASQSRSVNIKDYIRRGASEGSVVLEFEDKKGRAHRVSRKFKRNSKDAVASAVRLETLTEHGWEEHVSSISAVNFAVASLLLYGKIRDDVKDADTIKQAKSAVDISAFVSQGNISKILSVTPHERTALVSSALNIQDGDFLRDQVKELKKLAEAEYAALKVKAGTIETALKSLPELQELRTAKKRAEGDIDIYTASHSVLSEGAKTLENIFNTETKLKEYITARGRQEENISSMRNKYAYGEYIRARSDLMSKAASFKRTASDYFNNARNLANGKNLLQTLSKEKGDLANKKTSLYEKYSTFSATAEFYSILNEIGLAEKRSIASAETLKDKAKIFKEKNNMLEQTIKEKEKNTVLFEKTLAAEAAIKQKEAENGISNLSGTLLSHLVELLRTLGVGDIIDLNKLSLSGAEDFVGRMKDSSFQAILYEIKNKQAEIKLYKDIVNICVEKHGAVPETFDPAEKSRLESLISDLDIKISELETVIKTASGDLSFAEKQKDAFLNMFNENKDRLSSMLEAKGIKSAPTIENAEEASKTVSLIRDEIRAVEPLLIKKEKEYSDIFTSVSRWESESTLFERNKSDLIKTLSDSANKTGGLLQSCMDTTGAVSLRTTSLNALCIDPGSLPSEDEMRQADTKYSTLIELVAKTSADLAGFREDYDEIRKKDEILMPSLNLGVNTYELATCIAKERNEKASQITERTKETGRLSQQIRQHEALSAQLALVEEEIKKEAPLHTSVKQLSSLADANFGRYICDKTMEILFEGVNSHLEELGIRWTLGSDNGQLMVVDTEGETRPVAGMSGGEGTLISILLLKQISNFNCLWLDESLTMLDENKLSEVTDILTGGDPNAQVIIISHDKDLARTFDTVWKMDNGQKMEEKTPDKKHGSVITAGDLREGDFELI